VYIIMIYIIDMFVWTLLQTPTQTERGYITASTPTALLSPPPSAAPCHFHHWVTSGYFGDALYCSNQDSSTSPSMNYTRTLWTSFITCQLSAFWYALYVNCGRIR